MYKLIASGGREALGQKPCFVKSIIIPSKQILVEFSVSAIL
jgi:hypothetical protein